MNDIASLIPVRISGLGMRPTHFSFLQLLLLEEVVVVAALLTNPSLLVCTHSPPVH